MVVEFISWQNLNKGKWHLTIPWTSYHQHQCVCLRFQNTPYDSIVVVIWLYTRTHNFTNWLQSDAQTDHGQITKTLTWQEFSITSFIMLSCMVQELWAIFAKWPQMDTQCDYKAHYESRSFLSIVQCLFFSRFIEIWIKTRCTLHDTRSVKTRLVFWIPEYIIKTISID